MMKLRRVVVAVLVAAGTFIIPAAHQPLHAWLIQKPAAAGSPGTQLLLGNSNGVVSTTVDRHIALGYTLAPQSAAVQSAVFPVPGAINSLKFTALTQPTGVTKYTGTIVVNGSSTAATCDVTASTAICDWTGSVSVNAGDYAEILIHPTGTPTGSAVSVSVGWTPTTANDTILVGAAIGATFSTSSTLATQPFYGSGPDFLGPWNANGLMADSGTIDKMFINTNAPGAAASGKSYAFTWLKNATVTALTKTLSNTTTADSDTTHTVSIVAGDYVAIQAAPTGTPNASNAAWGVRFLPTSVGRYQFNMNSVSSPGNAAATYYHITNGGASSSAAEANVKGITPSQTFEKMQVKMATNPGAGGSGKKFTITLRKNLAATALTCDMIEIATTCSATGSVAFNDNDYVDIEYVPTGTPSVSYTGVALLAKR